VSGPKFENLEGARSKTRGFEKAAGSRANDESDRSARRAYKEVTMKLIVRTRHLELTPETHQAIRQRLYTAFARISPWIRTVDVTIADINGPKGGADKQCRLRVRGRAIPY
jgi:hypothetical protein